MNNFVLSLEVSGKLPMPLWEDLRLYSNNLCAGYVTFYYRLTAAERRSAPASLSKLLKAGLRVHLWRSSEVLTLNALCSLVTPNIQRYPSTTS